LVSSLLAKVTQQEAACAYVDVADAFDPLSGAAMGIDLGRLLWVRTGRTEERDKNAWTPLDQGLRATDLLLSAGGFRVIVLDMGDVRPEQVLRVPLASWYLSAASGEVAGSFRPPDTNHVTTNAARGNIHKPSMIGKPAIAKQTCKHRLLTTVTADCPFSGKVYPARHELGDYRHRRKRCGFPTLIDSGQICYLRVTSNRLAISGW